MLIGSLYPKAEEYDLHRNAKINGVEVDEMNGTCCNSGYDLLIKTITNGSVSYNDNHEADLPMQRKECHRF